MDKMTIEQAAEYVGKHPQTIRRWIDAGDLKAYRLGREYRIAKTDLDAMYQPVQIAETQPVEA